jgi:hypothetical protein
VGTIDCGATSTQLLAAARIPPPATLNDLATEPWFRVDPALDRDGALRAQRLIVGIGAGRARRASELPGESFVAGPFGRLLLIGTDDGSRSRLVAYDVARDCAWDVASEQRRHPAGDLDPASATVFETRVRAGVQGRPRRVATDPRRDRAGVAVLDAPPRTSASVALLDRVRVGCIRDTAGVQSCGELACRTRFVVAPPGTADPPLDPEAGRLSVSTGTTVAFAACRGGRARRVDERRDRCPPDRRATCRPGDPVAASDRVRVVVETVDRGARRWRPSTSTTRTAS